MKDLVKVISLFTGIALGFMLMCLLVGCKTTNCLPVTEYRDSIVVRLQHDTIQTYEKDSIYIHQRGDTVFRERWSIRYRDKVVERHDTIYQSDNKHDVEVREVVPTYYKGVSLAFWILVILLGIATVVRVLIRVYLKK